MRSIYRVLDEAYQDLIDRNRYRESVADELNFAAVHHLSAACRAAWKPELCDLQAAYLLRSITDVEAVRCREHREFYVGRWSYLICAIPLLLLVMNDQIGSIVVDSGISNVWTWFIVANTYLYDISVWIIVALYTFIGAYAAYFVLVFQPARRRWRQRQLLAEQEHGTKRRSKVMKRLDSTLVAFSKEKKKQRDRQAKHRPTETDVPAHPQEAAPHKIATGYMVPKSAAVASVLLKAKALRKRKSSTPADPHAPRGGGASDDVDLLLASRLTSPKEAVNYTWEQVCSGSTSDSFFKSGDLAVELAAISENPQLIARSALSNSVSSTASALQRIGRISPEEARDLVSRFDVWACGHTDKSHTDKVHFQDVKGWLSDELEQIFATHGHRVSINGRELNILRPLSASGDSKVHARTKAGSGPSDAGLDNYMSVNTPREFIGASCGSPTKHDIEDGNGDDGSSDMDHVDDVSIGDDGDDDKRWRDELHDIGEAHRGSYGRILIPEDDDSDPHYCDCDLDRRGEGEDEDEDDRADREEKNL
jgi:hypothetical protein